MRTRILSGVVIGVVLTAVLVLGGIFLWAVFLAVSVTAFFELTAACGARKKGTIISATETVGVLGILGLYVSLYLTHDLSCYIVAAVSVMAALFLVYVLVFPRTGSDEVITVLFCFLYAPCMLSFICLLRELPYGAYLGWLPFMAWVSDTCAYFAGMALGKHKLAPVLSPKKTIEGALGGIAGSIIAGVIFGVILVVRTDVKPVMIAVFAVITALGSIISQIGDLAASGIKRDNGIKDYGKVIPGHGGIMDRFDSVIMVSPVLYFLTYISLKVSGVI